MKKSELSFKCVACSDARRIAIFRALKEKGIEFVTHDKIFIYCTGTFTSAGNDGEEFDSSVFPEVTFSEALEMIRSIEPDAPEFDIKPFDRVLMRDGIGEEYKEWWPTFATCIIEEYYHVDFLRGTFMQMIKFEGHEHLLGTKDTPAGWWECENGKPIWRTK